MRKLTLPLVLLVCCMGAHAETSFIVNPWGDLECKRAKRPGVLLCDIDLSESRDDKHLRDRRPDLYQAVTVAE